MDEKLAPKDIPGMMQHIVEEYAELSIEIGHLIKLFSKYNRFGADSKEPGKEELGTNEERIHMQLAPTLNELADLKTSIQRLAVKML